MILLLIPCCLCVCGIVLTKNTCGAHLQLPLPYGAVGPPRKGGLFLLQVVGVDLVFTQKVLVILLGYKTSTVIFSEVLSKSLPPVGFPLITQKR